MQKLIGAVVIVGGILLGSLTLTGWWHAETKPPPNFQPVTTLVGRERPSDGASMNVNGWNLYDASGCPIATAFRNLRTHLGPPVGSFTDGSQDFLFGRLICVPTNGPAQQAIPDDLGRQLLLLRGLQEEPDASPDPVVHRWLLETLATGYDPRQIAGRVISSVRCDSETPKRCTQYLDKMVLSWTTGPDAVAQAEPIGCLMNAACQRGLTQEVRNWQTRPISLPLLGAALLLLAVGGLLLVWQPRRAGLAPGIA